MTTIKKVIAMSTVLVILTWAIFSIAASAADKDLNYDVLKHKTQDISMANDYFNKPAKLVDKNGKQYIQLTVNHSHWIVNFTFNGHKENIVNEDKAKDERTSEFPVDKTSGEVAGTIKVFIDEEVNGKPFKYDHNYNITYLLKGDANNSQDTAATPGADKGDAGKGGTSQSESGPTSPDGKTSSPDQAAVNPQTGAGESIWLYAALAGGALLLVGSVILSKRLRQGSK